MRCWRPPQATSGVLWPTKGYGADWLRADLRNAGVVPVISGGRSRNRPLSLDTTRQKNRRRTEALLCRLQDFRCVATHYDKLARDYMSAVALAAAFAL